MNRKIYYITLLSLRLILACIVTGYIHPNEFFQGGQELFFGCTNTSRSLIVSDTIKNDENCNTDTSCRKNTAIDPSSSSSPPKTKDNKNSDYVSLQGKFHNLTTTWEYQPNHAIRSIIPPTLMTLLPLRIYSFCKKTVVYFITTSLLSIRNHTTSTTVGNNSHSYTDGTFSSLPSWNEKLNGWEIFIIPRIFLALLSILTLDLSIWYIVWITTKAQQRRMIAKTAMKEEKETTPSFWSHVVASLLKHQQPNDGENDVPNEVIIFASSWPVFVFLVRPFSYTLETMCISFLLLLFVLEDSTATSAATTTKSTTTIPILTGILCSIGIYTRFTFCIFALSPIVIMIHCRGRHDCFMTLNDLTKQKKNKSYKKQSPTPPPQDQVLNKNDQDNTRSAYDNSSEIVVISSKATTTIQKSKLATTKNIFTIMSCQYCIQYFSCFGHFYLGRFFHES